MNLKKSLSTLFQILDEDSNDDITFFISDDIFVYDDNYNVTINYSGTIDDFYFVNIDGEITSL